MPETLPDDLIAAEDLPDDLEPATAEPRKPAHAIPLLGKLTELANLPGRYAGSWLAGGLPAEESLIPGVTPESVPPVLPIYPGGPPTEGIPGAIARGALKTGLGLGQYLTSPQGLTELSAGRFAPTALGYKWMLDMATGATDAAKEAYQKAAKGDWEGAAETAVQAGAMGFGLHGVGKGLFGRKGPAAPEAPAAPEVVPEPGGPPPISMGVRTVPNLAAIKEPTFEPSGLQVGGQAPPSALRQVPSPIEPEPLPGLPAAEPQPIPLRPAAPWELQRVRSEATPLREIQEAPAPKATLKTEKLKLAEELPDDLEPVAADVTMGVRTTVPEAPIGKPTFEPSGLGRPATGFEAVKSAAEKLFPGIEIKETSPRVGIEISPDGKTLHLSPRLLDDLAKEYPGRATEAFQKLVQEEVTHHRHLSRLGEGFNEKLADIWENAPENIKDLVQKIYGKQPGMEPHHWGAELLRMADQAKNVGDITETMHNWNADKAREAVGPLSEWAKAQTGDVAEVLAPEPQTKGEQNARSIEKAAEIHGDVRPQPVEGPGQVPVQEGGGGVQPLERGRQEGQAQGEVLLNSVAQMAPEEYFSNAEKWSKESMAEKGLGPARRAEQAAREFPDAEAWREAYMDAADEARRIRDEVKANPGTMMARQKEIMGAGQKRQFFQEGLKILEGEEGKPQPVDVATESARISEPKLGEQLTGPFGLPDPAAVVRAIKQIIDDPAATRAAFKLRKLAEKLRGQRGLIGRMIQTGDTRKAIIYTRDAADNTANLFARQMANEVRAPMHSDFKDNSKLANDALSFVVESEMKPERLDAFETQIQNSTRADPYWKKRGLEAIQFAKDNWNRLEPHAQRYKQLTDAQVDIEHSGGVDTLKRNGYVPHRQDVVDAFGMSGGSGEAAGFRKVRDFNTFADSIAAGMDPKSLNAVDLLESRIRSGQSMVNKRAWVDAFKNRLDKQTGQPVAVKPNIVTRADGTTYPEAPQGYSLETLNNQPIAVHNGYEGLIGALTDPSWFMRSKTGQNFMKGLGASKSVKLLLDSFHLMRVGFWNAALRSAGITTFKAPKGWSYKQGLTLLDFTESQIRDMARKGEIPQDWLPSLIQDKQRLTEMVNQGYNVGKISDSMYQDWIHNIPGIGDFNKFLFDKFQRGAMAEIGLLEFERLKRARPNMPDAQIARQVARDLNTRFGNLGRQGIFKSRTGQDIARTIALAPQWNEGLIRSEIFGAGQVVKAGIEAAQGQRIYMGTLGRALTGMVLAQFAANQLINMYTRGHPTWDNPEEGLGAKLSAWIPNPTWLGAAKDAPGFFLHPMGLAAETAHLLMQWYERTGDFRESLSNYIRSRASTALSPILTFITNSDFLGRKLKPGTVWGQMVKDATPKPIPTDTIIGIIKSAATGEGRQQYQGQFQKQLMASFGIKSENAPSPVARIGKLAKDFNAEHGVEPSAEFYVGDYTPATSLLAIGNTTDAKDKLAELMTKKTPRSMVDHFEKWVRHPFTGSKPRERQFFESLSEEQKRQYALAMERRKDLAIQAIRLVVELNQEQQEKAAK